MDDSTRPKSDKGPHLHVCPYDDCNKAFSRAFRLTQHIRSHTGERPYVCDAVGCQKSYSRAAHLKRHQETAHCDTDEEARPTFRCDHKDCGQICVSRTNLLKHAKRKHQDLPKYKCAEEGCDRTFNKKCRLRAHSYEHLTVLPFQCHHAGCEKTFKLKQQFDRHLKNHEGYSCPEPNCEMRFSKWSLRRRHIAVDHKKEYTCKECGKTLPKKSMLREHQDTHKDTREKYTCPYEDCPRSYFMKRNLTAHIKSYHLGKRFKCEKDGCERTFATKQKLQLHEKLHDPNRPLPKPKKKKPLHRKVAKLVVAEVTGEKRRNLPPSANIDVKVHDSDEDIVEIETETSMDMTESFSDSIVSDVCDKSSEMEFSTEPEDLNTTACNATNGSADQIVVELPDFSKPCGDDHEVENDTTRMESSTTKNSISSGAPPASAIELLNKICNQSYQSDSESCSQKCSAFDEELITEELSDKSDSHTVARCLNVVNSLSSDNETCSRSETGESVKNNLYNENVTVAKN